MSFLYFAYGSNLWLPQIRSRCASARPVAPATLEGWKLVLDKPSTDGSAKANIRPHPGGRVHGAVFQVADAERQALDDSEPRYTPIAVEVEGRQVLTYTYEGPAHPGPPYDWYLATCRLGASSHGLSTEDFEVAAAPDPLAPGLRPATLDDTALIQSIMADGMRADTPRYYPHPGEYVWWVYHDDPRYPDHLSTWVQGDDGYVLIDSRSPGEINVFTRSGVDRMGLIQWSQRRLRDRGEVAWIADTDDLVDDLKTEGYEVASTDPLYNWDLSGDIPEPSLPAGWELRALAGEHEANTRRSASHAAFESTMPDALHLQRYLDFMRCPFYVPERDLVAVTPDGRVASFMVWWGDEGGIAQIEPFGTHPDFHRQGIGRALLYYGLRQMKDAGMHTCRVLTNDWREATAFYSGVGFDEVGRIRWWKKA